MFNKESNYIKRTAGPKYSSYISDGFGRDRYIISNNGGLQKIVTNNHTDRSSARYYDFKFMNKEVSPDTQLKIDWDASNAE